MDDSPNELRVGHSWNRGGKNKKPLYVVIVMICALGGSLLYMFGNADHRLRRNKEAGGVNVDNRQIAQSAGQGIILPPPPAVPAQEEVKNDRKVTVITGARRDDTEALRKRREQQYLAALSSPLIARTGRNSGSASSAPALERTRGERGQGDMSDMPEGLRSSSTYDPAAAKDKEAFFERADTKEGDAGWVSRYTREDGRLLEIKTGTVIPAVMVGGINSDLPGVMIAQVSQNVYNTANGRYLLIPQGAKLYGEIGRAHV